MLGQVAVPTMRLTPALSHSQHEAGTGCLGQHWEMVLLLPKGVITGLSPWDWSDLPDSCAPQQHKHVPGSGQASSSPLVQTCPLESPACLETSLLVLARKEVLNLQVGDASGFPTKPHQPGSSSCPWRGRFRSGSVRSHIPLCPLQPEAWMRMEILG